MIEPTDHTPAHPAGGSPSIAEVAALTRRLRELSDRSRAADPAQRAAFVADKHALLARITDTDAARGDAEPASTVTGRVDARFLIDGDRFERDGIVHVVDDVPISHDGVLTVPTRAGDEATWIDLPAGHWVTLQDPDLSTGGSPPARRDDPAEIAARIAALRAQVAAHALDDIGPDSYRTSTDVDDDGAEWSR